MSVLIIDEKTGKRYSRVPQLWNDDSYTPVTRRQVRKIRRKTKRGK